MTSSVNWKKKHLDDKEIERIKKIVKVFDIRNGEELTKLYLKSDKSLLADIFEKIIKVSINEFDICRLYSVSLTG